MSKDLINYGFSSWKQFSKLKEGDIPEEPGVYVLRLDKTFGRLVGESDILYMGSTENLRKRLWGNYIKGRGGKTTKRIHYYLISLGYLDRVEVSWVKSGDYKSLEEKLREEYEKDHHELPPWNRQK
jgi:hypothetical protein